MEVQPRLVYYQWLMRLSAACSCPICISALHPLLQVFPGVDRKALSLLRAMLSFDPAERPTAEQALQHPYFAGLHNPAREPTTTPVSKLAFDFDRRKLTVEEVRELIYLEILEYHPSALAAYQSGEPPSCTPGGCLSGQRFSQNILCFECTVIAQPRTVLTALRCPPV